MRDTLIWTPNRKQRKQGQYGAAGVALPGSGRRQHRRKPDPAFTPGAGDLSLRQQPGEMFSTSHPRRGSGELSSGREPSVKAAQEHYSGQM
jgi:hypothetical protein